MITPNQLLKERVYSLLKENILTQTYKPGILLKERALSLELGVSRTPLREALKMLEIENLVQSIPYRGIRVLGLNMQDLKNIYQLRTGLEMLVIDLLVDNITDDMLMTAEYYLNKQIELTPFNQDKVNDFLAFDSELHRTLAEGTGNSLLADTLDALRGKVTYLSFNSFRPGTYRFAESLDGHYQILAALKNRDIDLARIQMKEHIQTTFNAAKKSYLDNK